MKSEKNLLVLLVQDQININLESRKIWFHGYGEHESPIVDLSFFNARRESWETRDLQKIAAQMSEKGVHLINTSSEMRIEVYTALLDEDMARIPTWVSPVTGELTLPGGIHRSGTLQQAALDSLVSSIGVSTHGIRLSEHQVWGFKNTMSTSNNAQKWAPSHLHEYLPDIIELEPVKLPAMWNIKVGENPAFEALVTWRPHDCVMVLTLVYSMGDLRELLPQAKFVDLQRGSGRKWAHKLIVAENHEKYLTSPELQVVLDALQASEEWSNFL